MLGNGLGRGGQDRDRWQGLGTAVLNLRVQ